MPLRLPVLASPFITVDFETLKIKVYKNPTMSTCKILSVKFDEGLRGLIDSLGNIYIWSAYFATHSEIYKELKYIDSVKLNINNLYFTVTTTKEAKEYLYGRAKWQTYNNLCMYSDYDLNKQIKTKLLKLFPKVN